MATKFYIKHVLIILSSLLLTGLIWFTVWQATVSISIDTNMMQLLEKSDIQRESILTKIDSNLNQIRLNGRKMDTLLHGRK